MRFIERVLTTFACTTFSLMCLAVFLSVVFRHFLAQPLTWSEEFSRIMLIWTVFIGAAAVFIRGEHIAVDFLSERLRGWAAVLMRLAHALLTVLFLSCLLIGAYQMIGLTWVVRAESVPIIRTAYQYVIVVIAAAVMLVSTILEISQIVRRRG
jgi:TRAP-type C4-dicarboxylate transport system permease small subunit